MLSTVYLGGLELLTATFGLVAGEIGLLAVAGGLLSEGLVGVAKKAERDEFQVVEEVAALAAGASD